MSALATREQKISSRFCVIIPVICILANVSHSLPTSPAENVTASSSSSKLPGGDVLASKDTHVNVEKRHISSLMRSDQVGKRYLDDDISALQDDEDLYADKRYIGSLARDGNFVSGKRNLASLVRNGQLHAAEDKRYLGALARNGDLMFRNNELTDDKRNLASLVRNGDMSGKRNLASLARNGNFADGKRNLASLARNGGAFEGKRNLASFARSGGLDGKRNMASLARNGGLEGKRNMASIARNGAALGKRNLASLARSNSLYGHYSPLNEEKRYLGALARSGDLYGKRYLGSLAASKSFGGRVRKSVQDDVEAWNEGEASSAGRSHEYPKDHSFYSAFDSGESHSASSELSDENRDPDELARYKRNVAALARINTLPATRPQTTDTYLSSQYDTEGNQPDDEQEERKVQKRFLGSLARGGWFPRQFRGYMYNGQAAGGNQQQKRHIGALARIGWLPAIRSTRYVEDPSSGKRNVQALARQGGFPYASDKRSDDDDDEDLVHAEGQLELVEPSVDDVVDSNLDDEEYSLPESALPLQMDLYENNEPYFLKDDSNDDLFYGPVFPSASEHIAAKRYLLLPAIDNLLLRRLYPNRYGNRLLVDSMNDQESQNTV